MSEKSKKPPEPAAEQAAPSSQQPPAPPAEPAQAAPPQLSQDDLLRVVLAACSQLSPESRAQAMRMGVTLPGVMAGDQVVRWGYLCTHCGHLALEFCGSTFTAYDGTQSEIIPVGVRFADLPFRQNMPTQRINRMVPNCQHCGQHVAHDMYVPTRKRIVEVAQWRESRRRALAELPAVRRKLLELPTVDVGLQDQPADTWVDSGAKQALSEYSDAVGLGALAFPQSR